MNQALLKAVIRNDDLRKLTDDQRFEYYIKVCEANGLDPLQQPYQFIVLNGKLTLYLQKRGAEQLRRKHDISIEVVEERYIPDLGVYMVRLRGTMPNGRTDEEVGVVPIPKNASPVDAANAIPKAYTKAKRRLTISMTGTVTADESPEEEVDEVHAPAQVPAEPHTPSARQTESTPAAMQASSGSALRTALNDLMTRSNKQLTREEQTELGKQILARFHGDRNKALEFIQGCKSLEDLQQALQHPKEELELDG